MAISVKETQGGESLAISFNDQLDFAQWDAVRKQCPRRGKYSKVYLDLRELDHIDLAGMGILLLLGDRFQAQGAEVLLLPCNPRIHAFLNTMGYGQRFKVPRGCSVPVDNSACSGACLAEKPATGTWCSTRARGDRQ